MSSSVSLADLDTTSSKNSRSLNNPNATYPSFRENYCDSADFYDQIDERISRKSYEYPSHQAKYVEQWLNDDNNTPMATLNFNTSGSSSHDQWGNIIGIRGYMKNSISRDGSNMKSSYNKLKFDYIRLKSINEKLQKQMESILGKFKFSLKRKDQEIELLKSFKNGLRKEHSLRFNRSPNNPANCDKKKLQPDELEDQNRYSNRTERRFIELELENDNLRKERDLMQTKHRKEIRELENRIERISSEPDNMTLIRLRNENNQLKSSNELCLQDFRQIKEKYDKLETELKSLLVEQNRCDDEKDKEISKVTLELNRIQVYHSKLEHILETERAIKLELTDQVGNLRSANETLRHQMGELNCQLIKIQSKSDQDKSKELQILKAEVTRWQENYERLFKEKSNLNDILRISRLKLEQLESKNQFDIENSTLMNKTELDSYKKSLKKCEQEATKVKIKLDNTIGKLSACELERTKLIEDNLDLNRRIESIQSSGDTRSTLLESNRLKEYELELNEIKLKLQRLESDKRDLHEELSLSLERLQISKQQFDQLKHRFRLQQQAFDEFRESKKQELARLRINLNFEQYDRQVALRSIEKELRNSLRELEAMKCRFKSKRSSCCCSSSACTSSACKPAESRADGGLDGNRDPIGNREATTKRREKLETAKEHNRKQQQQQQQQQVNFSFSSSNSISSNCYIEQS